MSYVITDFASSSSSSPNIYTNLNGSLSVFCAQFSRPHSIEGSNKHGQCFQSKSNQLIGLRMLFLKDKTPTNSSSFGSPLKKLMPNRRPLR